MALVYHLLFLALLFPQATDSSNAQEEAIQKTAPDRKLDPKDVQCGDYLWISTKMGNTFLYYFFGSKEWGKGKVGFYQQSMYHAVVNPDKDPPTVQRITDAKGNVTGIKIQMTSAQLAVSAPCLSGH